MLETLCKPMMLEILITDGKQLKDLQKDFNTLFPYLKIEFYDTPNYSQKSAVKSKLLNSAQTVKMSRRVNNEGAFTINNNMSVANFEKELWDKFGLSAQVFRMSGKMWIETSLTDSWTLERQNNEGFEMSEKSA